MKIRTLSLLFVLVTMPLSLSAGQGGPPAHAGQGRQLRAADELGSLERFLLMSDEQLDQLQQAIARVRAMSPAERSALKEKLATYRSLPEHERNALRAGAGWVSDQDRQDWPRMMHSLPETDRLALQAELQALPSGQRAARKHELLKTWRSTQTKKAD